MAVPQAKGKLYYRIGEVADMLGVNPSLIRYWEKEFSILKPKKSRSGIRHYTAKDIEQLKYVHYLVKNQGHTIEGAKKLIKQKQSDDAMRFDLLKRLEAVKSFMSELRSGLD